jgi:hypothetical protein
MQRKFVGTSSYKRSEEHIASIFRVEDRGNMFLLNVRICLKVHSTLQPRRPTSSHLVVNINDSETFLFS